MVQRLIRAGSAWYRRTAQTFQAHTIDKRPLCDSTLRRDYRDVWRDCRRRSGPGTYGKRQRNRRPLCRGSAVGGEGGAPRGGYVGGLIKAFGIGRLAGRSVAGKLSG